MIVTHSVTITDPSTDLQAAVDATPEGGILRLGTGTFTAPSGGLVISRAIEIAGSGMYGGTVIQPFSLAVNQPTIKFAFGNAYMNAAEIDGVYLHDFQIHGRGEGPDNDFTGNIFAGSYGIELVTDTAQLIRNVFLERMEIIRCGSHGLYVLGDGGASCCIGLRLSSCNFNQNWGNGAHIEGCTLAKSDSCLFASNYLYGAYWQCSPVCDDDYYEANCHEHTTFDTGYDAQAVFYTGIVNLTGVTFEAFNSDSSNQSSEWLRQIHGSPAPAGTMTGLCLNNVSGRVSGLRFFNDASVNRIEERAMFIDIAQYLPTLEIGPCQFDGCYIAISNNVSTGFCRGLTISRQNQHSNEALILGHTGLALPNTTTALMAIYPLGYAPAGQLLFDETLGAAKIWSQDQWREVVAGQVSYQDEVVIYEDEPVTY